MHSSDNHGSSIQSFALYHFIKSNTNGDVSVIDYRPQYIASHGNYFKYTLKKILFRKIRNEIKEKFTEFNKNMLKLTDESYSDYSQLCENTPEADVYITGSDQIWNTDYPCGNDDAYYLGFVKKGIKIAYAASLGRTPIPEKSLEWMKPRISGFDFISVREQSSVQALESIYENKITHVCDPTMFLCDDDYKKIAVKPKRKKYAVIYLCEKSPLLDAAVEYVREKYNCEIIQLVGMKKQAACDSYERSIGPSEWLGYIQNAEFVLSGSFHATVFSIIFKKQFIDILPSKNTARMEQLLSQLGLSDRIVRSAEDLENIKDIDYDEVYRILTPFVEHSKKYLLDAISSNQDIN